MALLPPIILESQLGSGLSIAEMWILIWGLEFSYSKRKTYFALKQESRIVELKLILTC